MIVLGEGGREGGRERERGYPVRIICFLLPLATAYMQCHECEVALFTHQIGPLYLFVPSPLGMDNLSS